jgi:hypothetical protein
MFRYENNHLALIGGRPARIFKKGCEPQDLDATADFSFLMGK